MNTPKPDVLRFADREQACLVRLLDRYGLLLELTGADEAIPGSYWGSEEAGLVGHRVMVRDDTPIHSILHEACHYICMDKTRRSQLHTDAGGGYDEENGVCYLQIVLAEQLPWMGRQRMFDDMDAWGYTFRLGSARDWFERDAGDARDWLIRHELLTPEGEPTFNLRQKP